MITQQEFMHIVDPDGRTFTVFTDPDRLEAHMKELSPVDAKLVEKFANGVRTFADFDMSTLQAIPRSMMGLTGWMRLGLRMMPFLLPLIQWGPVSAEEFAQRFKDPFLQRAIPLMFAWGEIPMMAGLTQLAYMNKGNGAFPEGGSLAFAQAIEKRYLELGGEIHYKSQVAKILVQNDRAVGVRLYNDEEYRADIVISASDARSTIYDLLGGEYTNQKIQHYFDGHLPVLSLLQVSLGVARDLSKEPHWVTHLLNQPAMIAGEERQDIWVKNYCFDPTLAPAGKSVIEVLLKTNYGYWQHIYGRKLYDTEQDQVADQVIDLLERFYPGLRADVEVVDVATPLSYERYTGNWMGSTCGWLLTKRTMPLNILGIKKTLPGLRNFYLVGQWVEPGGSLALAACSGRNAIRIICHTDKKPFQTSLPG
jgi:phytoene dehydrogenase-like protein